MKADKTNRSTRKRGGTRFPNIVADAEKLGVNRVTLYRALTGKWNLPGLRARYERLRRA